MSTIDIATRLSIMLQAAEIRDEIADKSGGQYTREYVAAEVLGLSHWFAKRHGAIAAYTLFQHIADELALSAGSESSK